MKKKTNYLNRKGRFWCFLVLIGLSFLLTETYGQVPSCDKFSIGINESGNSVITAAELLTNEPELPAFLTIRSSDFTTVYEGQVTDIMEPVKLELCAYVNQPLYFEIKNNAGYCSDTLHVSIPPVPTMMGRRVQVMCGDPLIQTGSLIGDTFPVIQYPCSPEPNLTISEDFILSNNCNDDGKALKQIIYREIEGFDAWNQRFSTVDTIEVFKHSEITEYHIDMDSTYYLYCKENRTLGPRIIYRNPVLGRMDTMSFMKVKATNKKLVEFESISVPDGCNMDVSITSSVTNNTKCEKQYQVEMELSQKCFFSDSTRPLNEPASKGLTKMEDGRFRLSFNVIDKDTLAPMISLNENIITSYTNSQNCEAPLILPKLSISEDCSGIRRVHASAPGFFTVNLKQNNKGEWLADEKVSLPKDGNDYIDLDTFITNAFKVYVEASDSCDLVSRDSFYIQVKDNTNPTVSLLKNIRVGLTGQLTWLDVSIMNEDSYDNCGSTIVLGRRTDWATAGTVNLCDGLDPNTRTNPIEAFYAAFLQDLKDSDQLCDNWLYEEWVKDSLLYCSGNTSSEMQVEIGGGWSTQIPFTCEDACKDVEVELLVLDNWCNWNTTRSTVKVRDKQPISIVQDLKSEISMNCSSYGKYYSDAVNMALELNELPHSDPNRANAFSSLDSLFGGYVNVWQDLDGQMTTVTGQNVIPSEHSVSIQKDVCENYHERRSTEVFDENNGQFVTRIQQVPAIRTVPSNEKIDNGIVAVNCSSSTYQKISVNINNCGSGTITRKFYIAGGCGETAQEGNWLTRNADKIKFTRTQTIHIDPDCGLSMGMFDMPPAVSALDVCNIQKNSNGNYDGELHPTKTGFPTYTWSMNCRDLNVGYQDKLYRLVGNNPIGQWKLVRNWHISDKCDPSDDGAVLHYEQLIILNEVEDCETKKDKFQIGGQVVDPTGTPIGNVEIHLQSNSQEEIADYTASNGTYGFLANKNLNYRIVPYKNDEMLRGISTFDLVMIQKDILNIERLDNVFRRIAADINGNGLIEATDIIELRKAILRPDYKFSNNTSYQFREVGSNANFTDVIKLDKDLIADFVGIKTGDVNFSANSAAPTSRRRGMEMVMSDQWLQRGITYRIPVRSNTNSTILGFQFELDLGDNVTLLRMESGSVKLSSEDYALLDDGKLTVSWFDIDEKYFKENEELFYLILRVDRQVTLKETLRPSATILRTESYVEPGIVQDLKFFFHDMHRSVGKIQNSPNPFRNRTTIQIDNIHEGPISLQVFDMTGKMILNRQVNTLKETNKVHISGSDLPSPGMYYYKITTSEEQWTSKMIYIQ